MHSSLLPCRAAPIFLALLVCSAFAAEANDAVTLGELSAWRSPIGAWAMVGKVSLADGNPAKLHAEKGADAMLNGNAPTVDLLTKQEFGDVELHAEFLIARHSNSGIYFMGRYELQIYDSFGVEKDAYPGIECGGIYPRWIDNHDIDGHSPKVNASRPAGQWQSFDVIFHGPRFDAGGKKLADAKFVQVKLNGKVIHENVTVTGPTRAAVYADEKPVGPIMLQGDHGPVAFRNIHVRELK